MVAVLASPPPPSPPEGAWASLLLPELLNVYIHVAVCLSHWVFVAFVMWSVLAPGTLLMNGFDSVCVPKMSSSNTIGVCVSLGGSASPPDIVWAQTGTAGSRHCVSVNTDFKRATRTSFSSDLWLDFILMYLSRYKLFKEIRTVVLKALVSNGFSCLAYSINLTYESSPNSTISLILTIKKLCVVICSNRPGRPGLSWRGSSLVKGTECVMLATPT